MFDELKGLLGGNGGETENSAGKWVNGKFVPNQPEQQYYQPMPQQPMQPQYQQQPMYQQPQGMQCPKCKGYNVNVQIVEVGSKSKTKKSGVGLGGHAHNAVRGVMAIGTLGASNLVVKKATGEAKTNTKTKNKTMCICQNCGHTWKA